MFDFNESKAVGQLAEIVALESGSSAAEAKQISIAAGLHDIGKRKIPADIIAKPGKVTKSEFEIMKTHTTLGAEILKDIQGELGKMARTICEFHHERHDGRGYWGKLMSELPYYVSVTAVADVFTALVCERPYKRTFSHEEAAAYIQTQSGAMFDPIIAEVFLSLVRNDSRVRNIFREVNGFAGGT